MLTKIPKNIRNPLFAIANRGFFLWVKYFPRFVIIRYYYHKIDLQMINLLFVFTNTLLGLADSDSDGALLV
jgi:hypothetical protein